MTEDNAKLFVNSPNAVDNNYTAKCNTAGAAFQAESGNVDIVAEDDAEALAKARESYLCASIKQREYRSYL